MSEELRPCPFCGGTKICTEKGINLNYCDNCSAESNVEHWNNRPIEDALNARIAELEALVDELKPYRDGYDPEEVFPPEDEWVWLRDCDDNIEPVQYSHKTEWYWNYEGCWMPDNGDIRRWYPIGKLPEVTE